jgi:hypothetical protein
MCGMVVLYRNVYCSGLRRKNFRFIKYCYWWPPVAYGSKGMQKFFREDNC